MPKLFRIFLGAVLVAAFLVLFTLRMALPHDDWQSRLAGGMAMALVFVGAGWCLLSIRDPKRRSTACITCGSMLIIGSMTIASDGPARLTMAAGGLLALLGGLLTVLAAKVAGVGDEGREADDREATPAPETTERNDEPAAGRRPGKRVPVLAALLAGTLALHAPHAAEAAPTTVFEHVRLLAMDGTPVREDQTVVVADGRIQAIAAAGGLDLPAAAQRIDGRGRTLIPGLIDMHVHVPREDEDDARRTLALLLANGVTTARSMAGHASHLALRKRLAAGELAGPRLVAAAPALNDRTVAGVDDAHARVEQARKDGYELIKSHHLTDVAVWRAVQDEARAQGLPVAGHVASPIGLDRALAANQQVEHLDGFIAALLPEDAPERAIPFGQLPPPQVLAAVERDRLPGLARRVAAGGHPQVPTLALFAGLFGGTETADTMATRPELRYVPAATRQAWAGQVAQVADIPGIDALGPEFVRLRGDIVRALADAGVPLMAGSDSPQAFMVAGFALHRELAALVNAGLTPLQALAAATRTPGAYLGRTAAAGTPIAAAPPLGVIAPGAAADLVLLDGNPDQDIAATARIAGVMRGGRWHDRTDLDALLDAAAEDGTSGANTGTGTAEVWLIRHAEAGEGPDPALTPAGARRADGWHEAIGAPELARVYATDTRRSRETAAAIAADTGATVELYDPGDPGALIRHLRERAEPALVVAHSNTLPPLAAALGAPDVVPVDHDEHDRLYRVAISSAQALAARPGTRACTLPQLAAPALCGQVEVAEGGSDPDRMIPVHYAVLPATGTARHDPLVVLPGGPGLGGVQIAAGVAQLFADLHRDRDLILIDQRGTGASNPLRCELPDDLGAALGSLSENDMEQVRACREALSAHADLDRYTTPLAVADMERVRAALGIGRWDLFGMSYGTRPALEYARRHPQRVGRLVIRAPAPVQMALPLHTPRDAQDAFDRLARACAADHACAARYPDLPGMLERTLARLEDGPVEVGVVDPRTGQPVQARFDRAAFGTSMFFLLYMPELYSHVPRVLASAAAGDFSPMASAVAPVLLGTLHQVALGHRWSVVCAEDVPLIDEADIGPLTRGTFMGRQAVDAEREACAGWPSAPVPADYLEPVALEHPVLLIAGTVDPVAPPRWGRWLIAHGLSDARLLVVDGASHMPVFPGCTGRLVRDFLDGTAPDALDAACTGSPVFADFVLPRTAGSAAPADK